MSLKMHHEGGHFYRKASKYLLQLGSVVFVAFTPIYHATAAHSPSRNQPGSAFANPHAASDTTKKQSQSTTTSDSLKPTKHNRLTTRNCERGSMRPMPTNQSQQIKKLLAYEQLCRSKVFTSLSFFIGTPTSTSDATAQADYVSIKLREFKALGVKPIVFMEPTAAGGLIDMKSLGSGSYDSSIRVFYNELKQHGITGSMMGVWVPIPEGNIPVWTSLEPKLFVSSVKRIATIQKSIFPTSKVSVLLDTMTYPKSGIWSGGSPKSLSPYVSGLGGLVDSVGLQGFPWVSPSDQGAQTNGSVSTYLKPQLAKEAARQLGVSSVWINSGTFSQKYSNARQKVMYTASERSRILSETLAAAVWLRSAGLHSSLHLFAENKLSTGEMTNWSYLQGHETVFINLAADARANGIDLWLYDS